MTKNGLRNACLVLGLFLLYSALSVTFGYAWSFIGPHYVAEDSQPGSSILLFIVASVPHVIAAFGAGLGAAFVLIGVRRTGWAWALAALITLYSLAGWSFGFRLHGLGFETITGWVLQAALIGAAMMGGFIIARRRTTLGVEPA